MVRKASEATPANWKDLSEAEKLAYISRNYGPVDAPIQPAATSQEEESAPSSEPAHQQEREPAPKAREPTVATWKDLAEKDKLAYIERNYLLPMRDAARSQTSDMHDASEQHHLCFSLTLQIVRT